MKEPRCTIGRLNFSENCWTNIIPSLFSLSDMAEAELAEADQGAIQSGEEEGREEAPQHYLLPEV